MSHFITDLDVRKLTHDASSDQRGTWKLLAPLVYSSDLAGRIITVPAGFLTDFASVPRLPVAFLLTGDTGHAAAVIHDYLYTTHQVDRATADGVFKEALRAGDEPGWRAWLMWLGVRVGGGRPWDADGPQQPQQVAQAIDAVRLP